MFYTFIISASKLIDKLRWAKIPTYFPIRNNVLLLLLLREYKLTIISIYRLIIIYLYSNIGTLAFI